MKIYDEYDPIASSVGLLKAKYPATKEAFVKWQGALLLKYGQSLVERPFVGSLLEAMMKLTPLTSPVPTRYLLLDALEWTAFFDNGVGGTDAVGFAAVLAAHLRTTGLRLTVVRDTGICKKTGVRRYGATIFEVFEGSQKCRRSVACANDGGRWVFEQFGSPFQFEDTDSYLAKTKRHRFDADLLEKYARAMGIAPFDEATYVQGERGQVHGAIIETVGNLPQSLQRRGLNEIREEMGLPRVPWPAE